jgi:hypothetical protein
MIVPARKLEEVNNLDAALALARRGFKVLPLHTPTFRKNGAPCSCHNVGCKSVGKHPRTRNGSKDATTDEATVRKLWGQWPKANIGIATGADSFVTLDIDPKHGGDESLARLLAEYGEFDTTLTSNTGSGGRHINFKHPGVKVKNVQGSTKLGAGLDFRGEGGYIVAPPSLHASGERYRWHDADASLAPMPDWLLAKLRQPAAKKKSRSSDPIPEGSRNNLLFQEGYSLRRSGYEVEQIEAKLREINAKRCEPPLDEDEVRKIAASAASYLSEANQQNNSTASGKKISQGKRLVALASDFQLFHTADRKAYATVKVNGHDETLLINSTQFRELLSHRFYLSEETTPSAQGLHDAIAVLSGRAKFTGAELEVYVRLASHDGAIYLDLCDSQWRVAKITSDGWCLIESHECPIRFRRPRGMEALPEPQRGGSIEPLWRLINIKEADRALVAAWLISAFRPGKPFPVLVLHGEQGSAKSTTARILRALIDPNAAPLRSEPREGRDLAIAANNHWLVTFDNLSHVPVWLSDALCRLATGGGFATRELHTNDDEIIFDAMRPVLMNGIEELATRSDLLDRSIIIFLPNIPEEKRLTETALEREFEAERAHILGALLDAVSAALARVALVRFERLPRMADFAQWAAAAEAALGFESGAFMRAYEGNREDANELALEASSVAAAVLAFMADKQGWSGTAQELLNILTQVVSEPVRHQASFPKKPNKLSGEIRRIAPNLRAAGLDVEFSRGSRSRSIILEKRR